MASLVVDAAYVHHGTAAASADCINGWSEAALNRIRPKSFKKRLESALGLSIDRACWCAARDGRVDAVANKFDKRLRQAGIATSYRRIKMDEVVCRNRDCVAAGTCPHLHRSNPVRCRRQAGVDVDVACKALQFVTEELMSDRAGWQSSTWSRPQRSAQPWLVLVAGDGDFCALLETAKHLGAKVAVAAWRRSVHEDLVANADAFLALDDDVVVWNNDDEEDEDGVTPPRGAARSPLLVPAQLSINAPATGRRSPLSAAPMPPAPETADDERTRALAESALLARLSAAATTTDDEDEDGEDELAQALESVRRLAALRYSAPRHPELEVSADDEREASELRHPELEESSDDADDLERPTGRNWDDWHSERIEADLALLLRDFPHLDPDNNPLPFRPLAPARPRHPELDPDGEDERQGRARGRAKG